MEDQIVEEFYKYYDEGLKYPIKRILRNIMIETKKHYRITEEYTSGAYYKGREMYHRLKERGFHPKTAFFNAELPGGFMFAGREMFNLKNDEWLANSFYPKEFRYPGKTFDNRTYLLDKYNAFKNNPDNWLMGVHEIKGQDYYLDGDMTNPVSVTSVLYLVKQKLDSVELFTSDGGFEVEGHNPEIETFSLKAGEFITGLTCVSQGGCMILKLFSILETWTRYMVALSEKYFEHIEIFKPIMSTPTNTEYYLICYNKKKSPKMDYDKIKLFIESAGDPNVIENQSKFKLEKVKKSDLDEIVKISQEFHKTQISYLSKILDDIKKGSLMACYDINKITVPEYAKLIDY